MVTLERVGLEDYGGKREAMVVHSLSGILTPLDVDALVHAFRDIARKIRSQPGDFILGLDGPGMVPALALGILLRLKVIFATKTNLSRSPKVRCTEPASPRPDIYIYGLRRGMNVIIVDDGADTGQTLASCIAALHDQGVGIRAVVTTLEAKGKGARELIRTLGYELVSLQSHDMVA